MKPSGRHKQHLRTWIEIDRKALASNYRSFRSLLGTSTLLMSVVKSNAYGHSLIDFSKEMEKLGIDWFGVDSIVEGSSLREAKIKRPILVLGYTLPSRIAEAVENNLSLTLADFNTLNQLKKSKKPVSVHVKIDTGMHRQGFYIEEIPKLLKQLKSVPHIRVEGMYTHFSSAKNPMVRDITDAQIKKFKEAIWLFEDAGYTDIIKHAGATAGAIVFPEARFDMVRIGIGLYGLWPSGDTEKYYKYKIKLTPALSWKTRISQIKTVKAGGGIGYDLTEKITRNTRVAILPVGYWHGFPRALSGVGEVMIKGKLARVLGRVSMDMMVVDITGIPSAKIGDEVLLLGGRGKNQVNIGELGEKAYSSSYELITRLNPLIYRIMV